jgi:antitoxin component YwqK of YwqJK toxin-antitoxin module
MKHHGWLAVLAALIIVVVVGIGCNQKPTDPDDTRPGRLVTELYSDSTTKAVVFYKLDENGKMTDEKIREVNYYPNKQKYVEANYKDGLKDGEWKSYREDGKLWSEHHYVKGKEDGAYKTYHENGKLQIDGHYKEGKESGTWIFYDKNGTVNKRITY